MNHDGVVVMVGTAVIIMLIIAVGYLWLQQRHADGAALASGGHAGAGTTGNGAAWQRVLGNTLSGLGTGVAGGGL